MLHRNAVIECHTCQSKSVGLSNFRSHVCLDQRKKFDEHFAKIDAAQDIQTLLKMVKSLETKSEKLNQEIDTKLA